MTTPITTPTDPVQQAAEAITRVGEAHQAAITAWSHDKDPATARTPPADLTSLDLAEALAAAGLIATETETRNLGKYGLDGITQTRNVTPWKDTP